MPRIAPDSNDVMVIPLSDGPTTFANAGTSGSADNWTKYGDPVSGAPGPLEIAGSNGALYIPGSYITTTIRNGAGGANETTISPEISLSGWVFLRRHTNFPGEIFNKQYFLNGWSAPFLAFGFQTHSSNDGQIDLYITLNGSLQSALRTPGSYMLPVGRWCHLGGTWDGTTLKMYINGSLSTSSTPSGTIDFGTAGNRGKWYVGGIPGTSVDQEAPVIVQDIRIADIARPQSYFAEIYYNGFSP